MHPGDITIADYLGIEKVAPEFDDNKGVSLVLVNNEAGKKAFEKVKVKEGLIWKQTKLEDSMQPPLKAPFPKPDNREQFWSDFENKSFEYVAKKYGGIGLKNDSKSFLRKIKRKIKKLVSKGGKRNSSTI
nr:Coenzyme F420 hydrogenase/dehydrogenase, beta subunit C-terminal domain [Ruminococcus sp. AF43-11]